MVLLFQSLQKHSAVEGRITKLLKGILSHQSPCWHNVILLDSLKVSLYHAAFQRYSIRISHITYTEVVRDVDPQ